ncbi:MAG TPA: WXG100 family type VII secretion target [Dermatophilaceae bacterium]|nr:WXG100 family type VII secretion target [Dermatophilaceae bacterium]
MTTAAVLTTPTVLTTWTRADPEALRAASAGLRAQADGLQEQGRRIATAAAAVAGSWTGTAAVAYTGQATALRNGVRRSADQLRGVAEATDRYAAGVREAQLVHRAQQAQLAQSAGQAYSTPLGLPGPGEVGSRQLQAQADAVADTLQAKARSLQEVLATTDPWAGLPSTVAALRNGFLGAREVSGRLSSLGRVLPMVSYWSALLAASRLTGAGRFIGPLTDGQTAALAAAQTRMSRAVAALRGGVKPGGAQPLALREVTSVSAGVSLLRRAGLVGTVLEGGRDLVVGDLERPGWRDVTARVAGGIGAGGAGWLLVVGSSGVGTGVAAVAVTGYGLWKLGTAVYDNREAIAGGVRAAAQVATLFARQAGEAGALAIDRGADAVRRGAARLRDGGERLRDRLEQARLAVTDGLSRAGDAARAGADGVRDGLSDAVRKGIDAIAQRDHHADPLPGAAPNW